MTLKPAGWCGCFSNPSLGRFVLKLDEHTCIFQNSQVYNVKAIQPFKSTTPSPKMSEAHHPSRKNLNMNNAKEEIKYHL
jgi:hypothetical protein